MVVLSHTPDKPMLAIRTRSPWSASRSRPGGDLCLRWKIAGVAGSMLLLYVFGTNLLFPALRINEENVLSESRSDNRMLFERKERNEKSNGEVLRLLTEKEEDVFTHGKVTIEQLDVLSANGGGSMHGDDVTICQDGLSNPLLLPVKSSEGISGNIAHPRISTLHSLHTEKCRNKTLIPYRGKTGKEWSIASRTWWKSFGKRVSKYRWCRGGSEFEVPDMKQVMLLRSEKERKTNDVTIVTQLSLERLDMLHQQCSLWPGSIAAVIYVPLVHGNIFSPIESHWQGAPLDQMVEEVLAFHEASSSWACTLDIEVVAEERCSVELAAMYPTNSVRNRALLLALTDLILLLDVDFIVSVSLMDEFQNNETYRKTLLLLEGHNALVLPAFEAWDEGEWGKRLSREAVKEGKPYIVQKFMYNIVMGFHMSHYPQGHEATNFWKWIDTTEPYKVEYETGFEPYIMMHKKYIPYYDERFRGYYWNKVQHLMHISQQNDFDFIVHPTAFVLHAPHAKANSKYRTKKTGQKERNHAMFLEALEDMKTKRFVPVTGFPHLCLPPNIQVALAEALENGEQKKMLRKMAKLAEKTPEEIEEEAQLRQEESEREEAQQMREEAKQMWEESEQEHTLSVPDEPFNTM